MFSSVFFVGGKHFVINIAKPTERWQKWTIIDDYITNVKDPNLVISVSRHSGALCVVEKDMSEEQQWTMQYV